MPLLQRRVSAPNRMNGRSGAGYTYYITVVIGQQIPSS